MDKKRISVIIPTLNEQECIGGLIQSLLREHDVEIIISDGNSQDQTEQICRQYPVRFIKAATGRGAQLNAGAEAAQGNILFFLHADSEVDAEVFKLLRNAVTEGRQWGCCKIRFPAQSLFYRMVAFGSNWRAKCFNSCYGDQGIFCTRQLFLKVGGYPEISLCEDLAFSHKLRRFNRACILSAGIKTSNRRFQDQGPVRTLLKMQMLKLFYYLGIHPNHLTLWYESRRAL